MKGLHVWFIVFAFVYVVGTATFKLWANVQVCREYFPMMSTFACLISDKTRVVP